MSLPPSEFSRRVEICKGCDKWKYGVCGLGHAITSTYGCPLKKFPPVGSAPHLAVDIKKLEALKPITWPSILGKFAESMARWVKAGVPLASEEKHQARFASCRSCPLYKNFQCKACSCIAYLKAKLATESCPAKRWPTP